MLGSHSGGASAFMAIRKQRIGLHRFQAPVKSLWPRTPMDNLWGQALKAWTCQAWAQGTSRPRPPQPQSHCSAASSPCRACATALLASARRTGCASVPLICTACTMRIGIATKLLAECVFGYYRIKRNFRESSGSLAHNIMHLYGGAQARAPCCSKDSVQAWLRVGPKRKASCD